MQVLVRLDDMDQAAQEVNKNIDYCKNHHFAPLPFLDADVVLSALPSYSARELSREYLQSKEYSTVAAAFQRLVGAHVLGKFLKTLRGQYFIPPGTLIELSEKHSALAKHKRRTASWLSTLIDTLESSNSFEDFDSRIRAAMRRSWGRLRSNSFHNDVRRTIRSAIRVHSDSATLDKIVNDGIQPTDVTEGELGPEGESVFGTCLNNLTRSRPDASRNNINDATNAATVAHVFSLMKRRRLTEGARFLPVLITNTRHLLSQVDVFQRQLSISRFDLPVFMSNSRMVTLSSALPAPFTSISMANDDFLEQFQLELKRIRQILRTFMRQLLVVEQTTDQLFAIEDTDDAQLRFHWEELMLECEQFVSNWQESFEVIENDLDRDRAEVIDSVSTSRLRDLLSAPTKSREEADKLRKLASEIRACLQQQIIADDSLLTLVQNSKTGNPAVIGTFAVSDQLATESTSEFLVAPIRLHDELQHSWTERVLSKSEHGERAGERRFGVFNALFRNRGAVVAIDLIPGLGNEGAEGWKRPCYRIIWGHSADKRTVAASGIEMATAVQRAAQGSVDVFLMGDQQCRAPIEYSVSTDGRDIESSVEHILDTALTFDYFEVWTDSVVFFADAGDTPAERQAGIMWHKGALPRQAAIDHLSRCLATTNTRWKYNEVFWGKILGKVLSTLELEGGRPDGEYIVCDE